MMKAKKDIMIRYYLRTFELRCQLFGIFEISNFAFPPSLSANLKLPRFVASSRVKVFFLLSNRTNQVFHLKPQKYNFPFSRHPQRLLEIRSGEE